MNKKFFKKSIFNHIGLKEKEIFFRNLFLMMKSGLAISEILDILSRQSKSRMKDIILEIAKQISSGKSLSLAFKKFPDVFSEFIIHATEAGEESGNLDNSLAGIADQINRERDLISKIRSAMAYPIIVIILSLVVGLGIAFVILPKITPLFKGLKIDLPLSTRLLIAFSSFIEKNGFLFFSILILLLIFLFWFFRQKFSRPFSHLLILNIPIVGKIIKFKNLSQSSSLLSLLIKSGISFNEALGICSRTSKNYYYHNIFDEARLKSMEGEKLSDCLLNYPKFFPEIAVSMIRVGEKSGTLEEELLNISEIYNRETDNMIKVLSATIEPVLLIVIGFFVGVLAVSVIAPIYKITGNIYR